MRKKTTVILLAGTLMLFLLTGCGAGAKATEQEADSGKNSDVVETDGVTGTADTGTSVGAENENIVLYAEIGNNREYLVNNFNYVEQPGTVNATEDILIYNDEGINVGYIKTGATVEVTEGADVGGWARFENPIAGTDYEYLYVLKEFVTDPDEITLTPDSLKQGIIDFVVANSQGGDYSVDIDYVFLDEKASDMEVYECNMESTYSDALEYDYWIDENFTRTFYIFDYKTLYIECENDVDGWITCRVYYKDKIDWEQYD